MIATLLLMGLGSVVHAAPDCGGVLATAESKQIQVTALEGSAFISSTYSISVLRFGWSGAGVHGQPLRLICGNRSVGAIDASAANTTADL